MNRKQREAIAADMLAIAAKHGAEVDRREEGRNPGYRGPSIHLNIRLNGCAVMVNIDDLHGGDGALLHWYSTDGGWQNPGDWDNPGEYVSPRHYTAAFNAAVGDRGQYRPHSKATSSGTWSQLAAYLDAGLAMAAAGTAKMERTNND